MLKSRQFSRDILSGGTADRERSLENSRDFKKRIVINADFELKMFTTSRERREKTEKEGRNKIRRQETFFDAQEVSYDVLFLG